MNKPMPRSTRCLYLLILLFVMPLSACGNSHKYYDEAMVAVLETKKILISDNMCIDSNDCSQRELVKFEAGSGVFINVYSITDNKTSQKIINLLCQLHNDNIKVRYKVIIYSMPHASSGNSVLLTSDFGSNQSCQ